MRSPEFIIGQYKRIAATLISDALHSKDEFHQLVGVIWEEYFPSKDVLSALVSRAHIAEIMNQLSTSQAVMYRWLSEADKEKLLPIIYICEDQTLLTIMNKDIRIVHEGSA